MSQDEKIDIVDLDQLNESEDEPDINSETEELEDEPNINSESEESDVDTENESDNPQKIGLLLGDIIHINNKHRPELNKDFLIEYIDEDQIKIADDKNHYVLNINKDLTIDDGSIENIELLYRNPLNGYALQNDLVPGTWITIYFDGDYKSSVTGEITNLEEDMIEVTTFPNKDVIYIDFSYKGLPDNIILIKPRDQPKTIEVSDLGADLDIELLDVPNFSELPETENVEMDTDQQDYLMMKELLGEPDDFRIKSKKVIRDADDIFFGDYMNEVVEFYTVDKKYKRYSLEEQTNDMLEDLLSSIPDSKRTRNVMNEINTIVERYVQLLKEFSVYDDDQNITSSEKKGSNYRPLVHSLYKLKKSLFWIIPVAKNEKKNLILEGENEDATMEQIRDLKLIIESYKSLDVENSYEAFVKRLQSWFVPFSNLDFNDTGDIIVTRKVKENFNVMINNLGDYQTRTVSCNKTCEFIKKKFLFMNYITYESLPSDTLFLQSLITLPEPIVRFSRVNLPGTDILTKSNISRFFINYTKLLTMNVNKVNVTQHLKNECLIGGDHIDTSLYDNKVEVDDNGKIFSYSHGFVDNIKNYYLDMDAINRDSECDLYEEYLTAIIPKTKQLFHLMKKYIRGQLSIFKIISTLEPFLIYSSDISFQQYIDMSKFLDEEISKYIKRFVEKAKIFQLLKSQKKPKIQNRIATVFVNQQEFYSAIVENIYGYNEDHVITSAELLKKMVLMDYGNVFHYAIRQYSSSLNDANVGKQLTNDLDTVLKQIATEQLTDGECKNIQFAKKYFNIDTLTNDNGKEIYYDKEFDKTPYSIVEDYEKERRRMDDGEFYKFISEKLVSKHNISRENVPSVIEYIRTGRKKVNNMDYAIIFNPETEKIEYFIRKNDVWEPTDIDGQPVTDELACILRETCNYRKNDCISNELDTKEIMASSIQKIVKEFDKKYEKTVEENKDYTTKMLKYYTACIPKLREIAKYKLFQYTLKEYNEGATLEDIELKQSPYASLRDVILGHSDIIKKYDDILKFVEKYTLVLNVATEEFDPVNVYNELTPGEIDTFMKEKEIQNHWLYCKETKIRLLPKFYYILAKTFVDTPSDFARRLDLLCFSIGKKSDDGDKYVDKYSGYTIRVIDFVKEYGETEDIEDEPILMEMEKKNMSLLEKRIMNIVKTMESNMRIHLEHEYPFILTTTVQAYNSTTITETEFNEIVAQRGKKDKTYKDYTNTNLLFLTLGVFFIAIQTSIPEIKFKYSFPGCRKSFNGYPLTTEDESGLEYIACVASKIKSSIEPWNVLKGKKDIADISKIKKDLKKMIDSNLIQDLGVKDRITLRIRNKDSHILDMGMDIEDDEHSVSKWVHFLPAIIPFHIKEIVPFAETFKTNLHRMFKTGNRKQFESIEALESKIIFYAYYFQTVIQKIVSKKTLLITNSQNQPYMDNGCCNEKDGSQTVLRYFEKESPNITTINEFIQGISFILRDIAKLTKSQTLFSNIDTKNVTYIQDKNTYNKDVIIRALMIINKHVTFIESQNEEVYQQKVNEQLESGNTFSSEEFINDLKKIGLEQRVFYREKLPPTPLDVFHKIIRDTPLEEATRTLEDTNNFLSIKIEEYVKEICAFILENHQFKKEKNREIREIKEILMLGNWKKSDTPEGFYKNTQFLKNMIYLFSSVFPWIILNKTKHDIAIPPYWGLSKTDKIKILSCIKKYYGDLETFFIELPSFYKSLKTAVENSNKYYLISEITRGSISEGLFGEYTSILLQKYCLLSIFHEYIVSINDKDSEVIDDEDGNELLLSGKSKVLKKHISGMLYTFIQYIKTNKVTQNIQSEEIMERVFLLKEKEKETFTERLERKDEYEREVDNVMKQFGLGDWGKGNKKSLFQYSKDGEDDALKEKIAIAEERLMSSGVTELNLDQYVEDEIQAITDEAFIDYENNDLTGIQDEYSNNFEEEVEYDDSEI